MLGQGKAFLKARAGAMEGHSTGMGTQILAHRPGILISIHSEPSSNGERQEPFLDQNSEHWLEAGRNLGISIKISLVSGLFFFSH